jgi:hypothetical protein
VAQIAFVLLDLRRMFHVAVLAAAVISVHNFGPAQLQVPVDAYLVNPILRTSELLRRQFEFGMRYVNIFGNRLSDPGQPDKPHNSADQPSS